jgi:hypothetical protein
MQLLTRIKSVIGLDSMIRFFAYRRPFMLPAELGSVKDIHVSNKYQHMAEKHASNIGRFFAKDENCRTTNNGVRKELVDKSFMVADVTEIAANYGAEIIELTVFRLSKTQRISNRGASMPTDDGWVSELWHSDNYPPDSFKIIIYLSDVGSKNGPFEYKDPVDYRPANWTLNYKDTRVTDKSTGTVVTGPAGTTIIFKNNIVHKGNYCRDGFRDAIMIGLRIR